VPAHPLTFRAKIAVIMSSPCTNRADHDRQLMIGARVDVTGHDGRA